MEPREEPAEYLTARPTDIEEGRVVTVHQTYMGDDFDQPTEVLRGKVRVSYKGYLVPFTKRGAPMDPAYIKGG